MEQKTLMIILGVIIFFLVVVIIFLSMPKKNSAEQAWKRAERDRKIFQEKEIARIKKEKREQMEGEMKSIKTDIESSPNNQIPKS
jgi:cell division protein FtsB